LGPARPAALSALMMRASNKHPPAPLQRGRAHSTRHFATKL
jgi:hypothetical protein